ncbi:MAG: hypothetical protein ACI9TH_003396, partial [Kiritimatiellia bacterium]
MFTPISDYCPYLAYGSFGHFSGFIPTEWMRLPGGLAARVRMVQDGPIKCILGPIRAPRHGLFGNAGMISQGDAGAGMP